MSLRLLLNYTRRMHVLKIGEKKELNKRISSYLPFPSASHGDQTIKITYIVDSINFTRLHQVFNTVGWKVIVNYG